MGQSYLKCCAVIFILSFLLVLITADQRNGDNHKLMGIQWYVNNKPYMPYSSHTQRQKRNSGFDENYRISTPWDKEQIEAFIEAVQEPPWSLLNFNEGKRHTVNFTPRLGRESGEENGENWYRDSELSRELMTQRSPPFAPRLGRRINYYFDPRLGKRDEHQKSL